MEYIREWLEDYGICQEFDIDDALNLIRGYEIERINILREGENEFYAVLGNVDLKRELKELGFESIGSGWFANEEDTIRIRLWKDSEIDFWRMFSKVDKEDREIRFRGKIHTLGEVRWVLERCFGDVA